MPPVSEKLLYIIKTIYIIDEYVEIKYVDNMLRTEVSSKKIRFCKPVRFSLCLKCKSFCLACTTYYKSYVL